MVRRRGGSTLGAGGWETCCWPAGRSGGQGPVLCGYSVAPEAMMIWDGELVKEAVVYRWIAKYPVWRVKWDRLGVDSSPTGMSLDDDSGPNILVDGERPFTSAIES